MHPQEINDRVEEFRAQMDQFIHALELFQQDLTVAREMARLTCEELAAERGKAPERLTRNRADASKA